jgi:hypothetical protein
MMHTFSAAMGILTPADSRTQASPRDSSLGEQDLFWSCFDGYLKGLIGISVFGGQITFTVVVSDIADPADGGKTPTFSKETVRLLVGISWLLFMVLIGTSVLVKMVISDLSERAWLIQKLGKEGWRRAYSALTFLLNMLSVAPFLFVSLAVVAYLPVVGWAGTAFVSLLTTGVLVAWYCEELPPV